MMLFKLAILLCLIVSVNSLSPKSEYFNISQQVLDITWGIDVIQPRFDLQRFLCDICDQLIGVAKVYVRNNNVLTGEHLIGFLSSQQYFQEFYESCSQQYDKSSAKSGNFLACSTVLEPIVEELKQILQQKGPNIVNDDKQICYEKGLQLCEDKKSIWEIFDKFKLARKI